MFTFVQSAAAKLATHTSRSAVTPVKSGANVERPNDLKLYEDVIRRLHAIESRDNTFISDIRNVGRRVFGPIHSIRFWASPAELTLSFYSGGAKKLLTKRNQTLSVSPSDESFCSPGSLDDDDMGIPVNLILRRPRVRNRRDACTKAPSGVHDIYIADAEGSYGPGYEYQGLCDILEESEIVDEDGDVTEVEDGATTPSVLVKGDTTARSETQTGDDADDADTPDLEYNNVASYVVVVNPSNTRATPFPISPFFCLPTTESTLAPPTPSESDSDPSTLRSPPVLVYESDSYEDALFAEFNAIIDQKAANE